MWKSLFGFGKKDQKESETVTVKNEISLADAIAKNKETIATLEKRQELIQKKILQQLEDAKVRVASGDKRGAMLILKRKKMLEQELDTLMGSHFTLEQQILSLETAQTSQLAVKALQQGLSVQKNISKNVNVDEVDQLMEDVQEQQDIQNEISNIISQGARITDDESLMAELDLLQEEEWKNRSDERISSLPAAPPTLVPPPIPRNKIRTSEEDELAALQANLNL